MQDIAAAMRAPAFVLYAGRKANALGLPLAPAIMTADSLAAALGNLPTLPAEIRRLEPADGWGREVAYDPCDHFDHGFSNTETRVIRRRDARPHRIRWQFADRDVRLSLLPSGGAS